MPWLAVMLIGCGYPQGRRYTPTSVSSPQQTRSQPQTDIPSVQQTEVRGVWVSNTGSLDWDSATDRLRRSGFNTMYVNFASGGYSFYPQSAFLPSPQLSSVDPIARGLHLAHQRGLDVHAKIIALFMFNSPKDFQRDKQVSNSVMRGPDLKPIVQAGYSWLCPSQARNRELIKNSITELLTRYPVDGLQFDYIRFSEEPSCYCSYCRYSFEQHIGTRVSQWPRSVLQGSLVKQFSSWREQLITDWVRELTDTARRMRPRLILSAAAFSDLKRAREEKAQNWQSWLRLGYIDYVCTMTYTTNPSEFRTLIEKQTSWAPRPDQIVVGIGSWKLNQKTQVFARIQTVRSANAGGFSLFSYDDAESRNFLPVLFSHGS